MSDQNQDAQILHTQNALSFSRRVFLRDAALTGVGLLTLPLLLPRSAEAGGLFPAPSPEDQKKVGDQAAQQVLQEAPRSPTAAPATSTRSGSGSVAALPARPAVGLPVPCAGLERSQRLRAAGRQHVYVHGPVREAEPRTTHWRA